MGFPKSYQLKRKPKPKLGSDAAATVERKKTFAPFSLAMPSHVRFHIRIRIRFRSVTVTFFSFLLDLVSMSIPTPMSVPAGRFSFYHSPGHPKEKRTMRSKRKDPYYSLPLREICQSFNFLIFSYLIYHSSGHKLGKENDFL